MRVLVVNSGSSSVKWQLIDTAGGTVVKKASYERVGDVMTHAEAVSKMFSELEGEQIEAVGHRVVHGGETFKTGVLANKFTIAAAEELVPLAPLHNPANLLGVYECMDAMPSIPNVMVFDTAFHSDMPKSAFLYALPLEDYTQHKIRRYGAHGTSHNYVSRKAAEMMGVPREELRIITVHAGNGCSVAAVDKGISVETSMGLTPLEGLVMGTRSGDIDPAAIQVLCKVHNFSVDECINYLNKKCGLKGMCGFGEGDMRDVMTRKSTDERAASAINVYCHRIVKYIGAYAAVMGGVDAVVWTAGVGNNNSFIRDRVMGQFEYLGAAIDKAKNVKFTDGFQTGEISASGSRVRTFVVKTEEELEIARETESVVTDNV